MGMLQVGRDIGVSEEENGKKRQEEGLKPKEEEG